jgi:uncharacterized membrane protein
VSKKRGERSAGKTKSERVQHRGSDGEGPIAHQETAFAAMSIWRRVVSGLLVLTFIGYQFLVHLTFQQGQNDWVRFALMLLPMAGLACWAFTRSTHRPFWFVVLLGASGALYLAEQYEHLGLVAAYGIPHAVIYLALLGVFGRTLLAGREALITRLARRVHGVLPPEMERYTRRLTFVWCLFFAGQVAISALLYKFASLDTWSLFINLLNLPLLALMFAVDYVYRVIRFRQYPQASILKVIQVFTKDSSSRAVE